MPMRNREQRRDFGPAHVAHYTVLCPKFKGKKAGKAQGQGMLTLPMALVLPLGKASTVRVLPLSVY